MKDSNTAGQTLPDHVPTGLPGGCSVYRATGAEELCYADDNVLRLFGCKTQEEFRALTENSFRRMAHPDDLERVEGEIYAQTFACGERHDYVQYRVITKQGTIRYVEDFGHLVQNDEGDHFFYVFAVDVEKSEYQEMSHADWETRVGYRRTARRNTMHPLHAQEMTQGVTLAKKPEQAAWTA